MLIIVIMGRMRFQDNCYYGKDEIPNGWSCLQLQYFSKIFTGNSLNGSQKLKFSVKADNVFCYVSTKDIDLNGNVNYENGIYTPINEKLKIAKAKSILICLEGANAGNKIAIIDKDINFVNKLACVEIFSVIEKFIYYFFCSSIFNEEFRLNLQGIIGGVPLSKFKELSILIPPLQEQQRIVAKLDELFALIDKIEKEQEEQDELEEYKKLAKEKVLELAVTGKLVKQDPNDEPASELLERIKKEKEALIKAGKIKKDKADSEPLSDDDKNYYRNIADNVLLLKLSDAGIWRSGSTPNRSNPSYYGGNIKWIKTGELNNSIVNDSIEKITDKALAECSLPINEPGNVLIAMYGATIGKLGIAGTELTTNQACCGCKPFNWVYNKYLFYYLMFYRKRFIESAEGGAQPNISREKILATPFIVGSYNYQIRVCKVLDYLFENLF